MPSIVWVDGKWHDRATAVVSVFDHGLLYGDGVFEGIRAYGGRVFRLAEHLDRLYASAKAIWLDVPDRKQRTTAALLALVGALAALAAALFVPGLAGHAAQTDPSSSAGDNSQLRHTLPPCAASRACSNA